MAETWGSFDQELGHGVAVEVVQDRDHFDGAVLGDRRAVPDDERTRVVQLDVTTPSAKATMAARASIESTGFTFSRPVDSMSRAASARTQVRMIPAAVSAASTCGPRGRGVAV